MPGNAKHVVFKAASDVKDESGHVLVTAYAALRPDGQWSLLLRSTRITTMRIQSAWCFTMPRRTRTARSREKPFCFRSAKPDTVAPEPLERVRGSGFAACGNRSHCWPKCDLHAAGCVD